MNFDAYWQALSFQFIVLPMAQMKCICPENMYFTLKLINFGSYSWNGRWEGEIAQISRQMLTFLDNMEACTRPYAVQTGLKILSCCSQRIPESENRR